MQYAILCYDSEKAITQWTKAEDEAAVAKLDVVEQKLRKEGRMGPVGRLVLTNAAKTVRKGKEPFVVDGPFAETKEQLLGFFIVECDSLEQATDAAKDFARASSSAGAFEVRELRVFRPGGSAA